MTAFYRIETVHVARNENYSLDETPFPKLPTKGGGEENNKESHTNIACHPAKRVYSLKMIQAHTSVWISHCYPKLVF